MQTAKKLDQSKLKTKAPADGSRRYKKGTFPAYDMEYNRLATRSQILNTDNERLDLKNAFASGGISECKSSLLQLVGNNDGKYKEGRAWYVALIPAAKSTLEEVYKDFKRWQKKQVSDGQSLKAPKEWPPAMLEERLKAEARLDVRRREKDLLEYKIEELKAKQGKLENNKPVLPNGPVCDFNVRYVGPHRQKELLDSVDGQDISYHKSGVPYINDERSPYHLMPVATYRKMSKQWMKENRIRRMDLVERRNEYEQKMTEEGKADQMPPMFSVSKFESMLKRNGDWPESPEWPEDAEKITKIVLGS